MVIWLGGFGFFWSVNKTFKGEIDWKFFFPFFTSPSHFRANHDTVFETWKCYLLPLKKKKTVFQNRWGIIIYYFSLNYSFNCRPSGPFGILLAHFHNSDALDQVSGYQPKEQKEIRTRLGYVLSKSSVKPYP